MSGALHKQPSMESASDGRVRPSSDASALGEGGGTAHRERGAVAVEFALILPLLLLILFGTIEFGRVYSQHQVFQGAAREGARCAAVAASSNCVIQDKIDGASGSYTPATTASVQVGVGAILSATDPNAGCTNATKGQDVRVYWSQPLSVSVPFWGDVTMNASIEGVFRCE